MNWRLGKLFSRLITLLCAVTIVAACSEGNVPLPASPAGVATFESKYTLGVGDRFRLNVYNEPTVSGLEFGVGADGTVSLPLVGPVPVAGKTIHDAELAIAAKYADGYLANPKVNVDITAYRPFYILGEVKLPGEYPFANGLTVLSAVAKAGGFTYRANQTRVFIRHSSEGAEHEYRIASDTPVLPGDTVRVIERFF